MTVYHDLPTSGTGVIERHIMQRFVEFFQGRRPLVLSLLSIPYAEESIVVPLSYSFIQRVCKPTCLLFITATQSFICLLEDRSKSTLQEEPTDSPPPPIF